LIHADLPIVEIILEWYPTMLQETIKRTPNNLMQSVASDWQRVTTSLNQQGESLDPAKQNNYVATIRLLLDAGAGPDEKMSEYSGYSPLGYIATIPESRETLQAAKLLLQRGASVEKRTRNEISPLMVAVDKGNEELVRMMILQAHKPPTEQNLDEALALTQSNGVLGDPAVQKELIEHGANINLIQPSGGPALLAQLARSSKSQSHGNRALLLELIRHKADPNIVRPGLSSPLMDVIPDIELMKGLLDVGANPNFQDHNGDTPLLVATRAPKIIYREKGDSRPVSVVEPMLKPDVRNKAIALLLQYGANPNVRNHEGITPLMQTEAADAESIKLLVQHGGTVNVNAPAFNYYRQYHASIGQISWALVHHNDALAVSLLMRNGQLTPEDCGAMYYASQTGAIETLVVLIDRKLSVYDVRDEVKLTPLLVAAREGQVESIKILLDRKVAKIDEATPLEVATPSEIHAMASVGLEAPYYVEGGRTALMIAAQYGQKAAVEELIKRGANINQKDYRMDTALDYARRSNSYEIVDLLKKHGAR
jgi:ankyrin repeat protein